MNRSPNCHRTSHQNIFGARAQLNARSHYCCSYSLVNFVLLHVNKQMEMQFLPRRGISSNQHITGGTLVMISAPVTAAKTGAAPLMSRAAAGRGQCLHLPRHCANQNQSETQDWICQNTPISRPSSSRGLVQCCCPGLNLGQVVFFFFSHLSILK